MLRRLAARRAGRRDPLGAAGERQAKRFLKRAGYRVMAMNVRVRAGEADLVCLDPDRRTIVIVEVKARRRDGGGGGGGDGGGENHRASDSIAPEAAITSHKKHKLRQITRSLVKANRWEDRPVRIDVVAIEWPSGEMGKRAKPTIRHFEGAVGDF